MIHKIAFDLNSCLFIEGFNADDTHTRVSPVLRQIITIAGPLLLTTLVGMTLGYSAILIPQLQLKNSTSSFDVNREDASWVASLAILPMIGGTLLGGYLIQCIGRKKTHIMVSLPYFMGWLSIYIANGLTAILIGRFLTGFASGIITPATGVYIGEISEPKIRGILLGGIALSVSVGVLVIHLLGTFFTWQTSALIVAIIPVLSCILMIFTPESPVWLAQNGFTDRALMSLKWLRSSTQHDITDEFTQISARAQLSDDQIDTGLTNKFTKVLVPEFWKPLGILIILYVTTQWSGNNAVTFYSVDMMRRTLDNSLDKFIVTLIIDCFRVISSVIACILLRRIKRRTLITIGGTGTFISLFILSGLLAFTNNSKSDISKVLNPVAIICVLVYIFFVTIGFVTLPWTLQGELLPLSTRSIGSGIASSIAYLSMFSVVKTMPLMFESLGSSIAFLIYGIMTVCGTVFAYFCLPETHEISLDDVEKYFQKKSKIAS